MDKNMDCWNRKCVRNFGIISVLLVLATLLLFGSICKNCYGTSASDTTSVYRINHELVQMNRQSVAHLSMSKKGFLQTKDDSLKWKLDSMEIALRGMNNLIEVLEQQTEIRQNDMRQETNNIINKFNGNIEWWIFLLGVICGVAPILLAYLNHKNDSEYMKLLSEDNEKTKNSLALSESAMRAAIDDMKVQKMNLNKADKDRERKWNEHQEEMGLVCAFMYVSSFSRKSKFQAVAEREVIAENLLYDLLTNSIACAAIPESKEMKKEIPFSFWLTATVEGIELLLPFQSKIVCMRHLRKSLVVLHALRKRYYAGEHLELRDDEIQALRAELDRAKRTLRG